MKKFLLILFSITCLTLGSNALLSNRYISHAEDDEEEQEDDHEDERDQEKEVRSDDSATKQTNTAKEPTLVPVTTITQQEVTTVLTDSDGDGLYDNEDPHPNIPELYIVSDDNRNGIADRFESSP